MTAAFRRSVWWEPFWSALIACAMSMVVFLPILDRWASAWAPGDMLSTYNNAAHWSFFGYGVTDQAGFPGGMDLNLFPGVDITQNAFAAAITAVSGSPFLGINLLIIVSFPITAALAAVALRLVGLRGWWAIALAVAFTMIPYHFGRSLGHAYLSTVYAAVTAVILALTVGGGRWAAMGLRTPRTWLLNVPVIMITAWSGIYYAAFGALLLAAAVFWRFLTGATGRETLRNLVPLVVLVAVTVLGLLPAAFARVQEDVGGLGDRPAYESVALAGALAMALLPAPISVLPRMGYVNEAILGLTGDAPFSEAIQVPNFGTWITTGCLALAVVWVTRRVRRGDRMPSVVGLLTFMLVVTLLFFVPWGLNSLVAEFLTAQIRAWNRLLPILLLLFVLLGGAAIARIPRLQRSPWIVVGPCLILGVVLIEQVIPFRPLFAENAARYGLDTDAARVYATQVNTAIPERCGVVQLPHMVYPENGQVPPALNDYEHFWQSLTNGDKAWTYGAVRASASGDRAAELARAAEAGQGRALAEAGICAIHIDLRGYRGPAAREVTATATARFGAPVVVGRDGDWLLFRVGPRG